MGYQFFLSLSGYLIGGILLDIIHKTEFKSKDLVGFWVRRWFRTLPNYLLILGLLVVARLLMFGDLGEFSFSYLVFLQNFYSPHPDLFC